ncbi:MAG: 5'/3'-nucleotidase SurE [Firmicutes bacterium]|nr:5'/3'-nucleotidase SurE [Bacillota bacterium]
MNILITNDDSISSEAMLKLASWARRLGEVTVVAPKTQQSAKSQSINLRDAFEVRQLDLLTGVDCWSVDSTPADCVRFAVDHFGKKFELLFSGINYGYNMGTDILYSGTVAACFEGAVNGIPSIALSSDFHDPLPALNELDGIWEYFLQKRLLESWSCYNVNIPLQPQGFRLTRQGGAFFRDSFTSDNGVHFKAHGKEVYRDQSDMDLDTDCVRHGYISISPLSINRIDDRVLEMLRKNEFQ